MLPLAPVAAVIEIIGGLVRRDSTFAVVARKS
jgi:hypothetical protein